MTIPHTRTIDAVPTRHTFRSLIERIVDPAADDPVGFPSQRSPG
jgi:hypothetical protein